ncbi:uncharacterized protein LOC128337663 isoform X4 [Hemicordylus capensis]|uniref:uncharacterized protein LOC128337663 isoform X4 n=1 Tax=Hemicordylus capensis TaxID=884348 RepID=UPI0023031CA0|nr:uncharacterized protein LOC128337663 isoform X4 [Hemicordylus capensis]
MCAHLLGILLLFLHTAAHSQGGTEIPQQLTQVWASPGEARNITCDLPDGAAVWKTTWYKEEQDGSLRMIEPSYNERTAGAKEPLASPSWHCPPWRGLHLFTVSPYSASSDAHLDWGEISWNIGGETSRDQKDADMVDGEGVFSIWSLKLMSPELWTQGMSYSCSIQENRNISAVLSTQTVSTNTGNCASMLYLGIRRFFILLLIPAFALIIRMHLAQGNVEQPADQIPMREIPEWISIFLAEAQGNLQRCLVLTENPAIVIFRPVSLSNHRIGLAGSPTGQACRRFAEAASGVT